MPVLHSATAMVEPLALASARPHGQAQLPQRQPPSLHKSPPPPPALEMRPLPARHSSDVGVRVHKPWDGRWRGPYWPDTRVVVFRRPQDGRPGLAGEECRKRGVYSPQLHECRCTAGWDGRFCERRYQRSCNLAHGGGQTNRDSLCAGNCDDDRGLCYCAGLAKPFQRPLPHYCGPWVHETTKLPDGRPAYPVRTKDGQGWEVCS